eukprot:m.380246 g.380246  ORF g.380246 m.380246 type:complete len:1379 (-) comp20034_c1_seq4:293-4429(-)
MPHPSDSLAVFASVMATAIAFAGLGAVPVAAQEADLLHPLACNAQLRAADNAGTLQWRRWSDRSTWSSAEHPPSSSPGDIEVPCGVAILLDVPAVACHGLRVTGWLRVEDARNVHIQAHSVLVRGRLLAGSPTRHFHHHLLFWLLPSPTRSQLTLTANGKKHTLGHKAFAVAGGSVALYGHPYGCPTWVRLRASAAAGQQRLLVTGGAALLECWAPGDVISLGSTDFDQNQEEKLSLARVELDTEGNAVLHTTRPLAYPHWGDKLRYPWHASGAGQGDDVVPGKATIAHHQGAPMLELSDTFAAEVALIKRNIIITSPTEDHPNHLHGGHFMVYRTAAAQTILGVHFLGLGQQGILGRYSVHFHMLGQTRGIHMVRDNLVSHSHQRGFVVHGTHGVRIENNVCVNVAGHVFILEDGVEHSNVFVNNLAMTNTAVQVDIDNGDSRVGKQETDRTPSCYWISNPDNTFIGNVASGGEDTGFWFEMSGKVRGPSLALPGSDLVQPRLMPIRHFINNTAHGQERGFRTYPNGHTPLYPNGSPAQSIVTGLRAFKNRISAVFVHNSDNIVFRYAQLADHPKAIDFDRVGGCSLVDSVVVGESDNVGACLSKDVQFCMAFADSECFGPSSESMALAAAAQGRLRSLPVPFRKLKTLIGVELHQHNGRARANANRVVRTAFFGFAPKSCRQAAGITVDVIDNLHFFDAGNVLEDVSGPDGSLVLWIPPAKDKIAVGKSRSVADHVAVRWLGALPREADGTVLKPNAATWPSPPQLPTYVVARNNAMVDDSRCTLSEAINGYVCRDTCYRTIQLKFKAPPDADAEQYHAHAKALFHWTASDGTPKTDTVSPTVQVNVRPWVVRFTPNLLAGVEYRVELVGPVTNLDQIPHVDVQTMDGAMGCAESLGLVFPEAMLATSRVAVLPNGPSVCDPSDTEPLPCWKGARHFQDCDGNATKGLRLELFETGDTPIVLTTAEIEPCTPCQTNEFQFPSDLWPQECIETTSTTTTITTATTTSTTRTTATTTTTVTTTTTTTTTTSSLTTSTTATSSSTTATTATTTTTTSTTTTFTTTSATTSTTTSATTTTTTASRGSCAGAMGACASHEDGKGQLLERTHVLGLRVVQGAQLGLHHGVLHQLGDMLVPPCSIGRAAARQQRPLASTKPSQHPLKLGLAKGGAWVRPQRSTLAYRRHTALLAALLAAALTDGENGGEKRNVSAQREMGSEANLAVRKPRHDALLQKARRCVVVGQADDERRRRPRLHHLKQRVQQRLLAPSMRKRVKLIQHKHDTGAACLVPASKGTQQLPHRVRNRASEPRPTTAGTSTDFFIIPLTSAATLKGSLDGFAAYVCGVKLAGDLTQGGAVVVVDGAVERKLHKANLADLLFL